MATESVIFLYSQMSPQDKGKVDLAEEILFDLGLHNGPIRMDGGLAFEILDADPTQAAKSAGAVSARLGAVGVSSVAHGPKVTIL